MKKYINVKIFICILIIIATQQILIISFYENTNVYANLDEFYYAQVQDKNVYLYNAPNGTPLFEIPETFYVKLTKDAENGYYKATYQEINGYVLATEIQCVANEPATPYLYGVSFRNYGQQSSELRTEPTRMGGASTLICELPLYETNFSYIGKICGEEVVPNRGDIWYYCKYIKNNQEKIGYIYSGLIDMMTTYYNNPLDSYPIIKHQWKENTNSNIQNMATIALPNSKETLIILAICIPTIVIIAFLFSPVPKLKTNTKSHKNKCYNNSNGKSIHKLKDPRMTYNGNYNKSNQTYFKSTHSNSRKKDYYEI